ncbi:MAG: CRISPR-associated helicase Cas3', partial [Candidatus Aenigmatarchaeota archaeon]
MEIRFLKNEDLSKISHIDRKRNTKKTLEEHIKEIKFLGEKLKEFFDFDYKLFECLAEFHDIGKLNKLWDIEDKNKGRKINHSEYSMYYTFKNYKDILKEFLGEKYFLVLLFLIYRHHTLLDKKALVPIRIRDLRIRREMSDKVFKEIKEAIKSLSFSEKIKIVDSFGIFKFCDSLSAKFLAKEKEIDKILSEFKRKKEIINSISEKEKFLKNYIKNEKGFKIDYNKLEYQKNLSKYDEMLFVAPTGWGKTVSSILFGKNRLFITLPTITAIRDFYKKLEFFGAEMYFYLYDAYVEYGDFFNLKHEYTEKEENLIKEREINLWFSQIFFNPIMITTIDQILLTFLQSGKYYLRRYNFQNSSIICDEVHLLTPQMLYFLLHFYKIYKHQYNLRLLLTSATLPKAIIEFIKKDILPSIEIVQLIDEYKKLRRVLFKYFEYDIVKWLKENIDFFEKIENKKIVIILNTVRKAQEVYRILKERYKDSVILLHSRFITKDRFEKEEKFKNYKIVVSTQVVEVSLDFSWDFLLTELASLPSLVQRFGRVNRYYNKTDEINVYIFKPEEFEKTERVYPYDIEDLQISEKILKEVENDLKSEYDLIEKLNKHYTYQDFKRKLKEFVYYDMDIEKLLKY